jgi:hypothetical protein
MISVRRELRFHPATQTIQITATPTVNGFPNPISFGVSGLPAGSTGTQSSNADAKRKCDAYNADDNGWRIGCFQEECKHRHVRNTIDAASLAIWMATLLGWVYLRL